MKEHTWLVKHLESQDGMTVSGSNPKAEGDGMDEIECGCCFASYPFVSRSRSLPALY